MMSTKFCAPESSSSVRLEGLWKNLLPSAQKRRVKTLFCQSLVRAALERPEKIFCFFVEMQMTNGYKYLVLVLEILHLSVRAFYNKETGSLCRDSFISNIE